MVSSRNAPRLRDYDYPCVDEFIEQANKFHPTIKFGAEISKYEITFLDKVVFKGKRLKNESILDIKTEHYKPTENLSMHAIHLIQNQPMLKTIHLKPPIVSYKRGKSLKDTLLRSKI